MSKTLTTIKTYLSNLYTSPAQGIENRTEIRRIVEGFAFTSNTSDLYYEDLDSAAALCSN